MLQSAVTDEQAEQLKYKMRYRLLKERYRHTRRQNETLADECLAAMARLNRFKMEKNIMLDDLMRSEQNAK